MHRLWALLLVFLTWAIVGGRARLMRVATLASPPFFQPTSSENPEGFLVDLLDDLRRRVSAESGKEISFRFYEASSGRYGRKNTTGHWIGLIGEVVNGEADLAAAPLIITKERNEVVHFTHPFSSFAVVPLVKKPPPGQPLPFDDLPNLKAKLLAGNLTLGNIKHGATENFLRGHKSEFIRSIFNISTASESAADGIRRVRDDPRFVFFGEHTTWYAAMSKEPCDLEVAWSAMIGEGHFGLAFPRTSIGREWVQRFNEAIVDAQQDGTIAMLFHRWWFHNSQCPMFNTCGCRGGV